MLVIVSFSDNDFMCQGWDDAYVPRTHEGLLKWKYPEMNSVDFLFEVSVSFTTILVVPFHPFRNSHCLLFPDVKYMYW